MRDPNNFKDQVADLMDKHDGMKVILEHFKLTSDTAAEAMVSDFLEGIQFDIELKQKLKGLGGKI